MMLILLLSPTTYHIINEIVFDSRRNSFTSIKLQNYWISALYTKESSYFFSLQKVLGPVSATEAVKRVPEEFRAPVTFPPPYPRIQLR